MRGVPVYMAFAGLLLAGLPVFAGEVPIKPVQFERTEVEVLDGEKAKLPAPGKKATVLVFLSCDCPIANAFAPELGRIYDAYKDKDVAFYRVYPDTTQDDADIRQHAEDYNHRLPAIRDAEQLLVRRTGARITPEAVVLDADGAIVYRGRINNLYADIGKRRRQATTADLRDALDAVLAGKEVKKRETRAFGCYIPLEFDVTKPDAAASEA